MAREVPFVSVSLGSQSQFLFHHFFTTTLPPFLKTVSGVMRSPSGDWCVTSGRVWLASCVGALDAVRGFWIQCRFYRRPVQWMSMLLLMYTSEKQPQQLDKGIHSNSARVYREDHPLKATSNPCHSPDRTCCCLDDQKIRTGEITLQNHYIIQMKLYTWKYFSRLFAKPSCRLICPPSTTGGPVAVGCPAMCWGQPDESRASRWRSGTLKGGVGFSYYCSC